MVDDVIASDLKDFILGHIDSVAQLEALLMLRANPDKSWDVARTARRLYIGERDTAEALAGLSSLGLLSRDGDSYRYAELSAAQVAMMDRLAEAYARHLIPVTNIIHRKPRRIREFADAFKFKKER